jgi:hypothetical protein
MIFWTKASDIQPVGTEKDPGSGHKAVPMAVVGWGGSLSAGRFLRPQGHRALGRLPVEGAEER